MGLDILTEAGQITVEQENRAREIFEFHNPGIQYCPTPKDAPAKVDAVLMSRSGDLLAVVETKCRNMTVKHFREELDYRWLVTWEKVESARVIASQLCLPFYGFLYLTESDTLMVLEISDHMGLYSTSLYIEATKTQETVNGGETVRNNAYIDMNAAERYALREDEEPGEPLPFP